MKTCLAKDPDARWQSAHDVKLELTWLEQGVGPPAAVSRSRNRERVVFAIGLVLLVSFCRETLGMAVLQAVRIYTEAPEWLSWA